MQSVCIVGGLGHIGLPLGIVLASIDFDVSRLLGFSAETTFEESLDEITPWVVEQIKLGGI